MNIYVFLIAFPISWVFIALPMYLLFDGERGMWVITVTLALMLSIGISGVAKRIYKP